MKLREHYFHDTGIMSDKHDALLALFTDRSVWPRVQSAYSHRTVIIQSSYSHHTVIIQSSCAVNLAKTEENTLYRKHVSQQKILTYKKILLIGAPRTSKSYTKQKGSCDFAT